MDHLCYLCLVFFMLSNLFTAALWSAAGEGRLFMMFNCVFVTFPCGVQFFVAFPWVETSTGPGGFMTLCVYYMTGTPEGSTERVRRDAWLYRF